MSIKKGNFEKLIEEYLLDEGILSERLSVPEFDFGFIISFPPGPKSQKMSVYKPKNKNNILITIRSQISEKNVNKLNSLKENKKFQFFNDLRKYFLIKEVYFRIDIQNFRFTIDKQIYPDNKGIISKHTLFKGIQKIFYCFVFSNILLEEYCLGKERSPTKLGPEFDLSLYS